MHAKNSILIQKRKRKKKGDTTFDVTIGSYDGAETCELVGSILLSQLRNLAKHHSTKGPHHTKRHSTRTDTTTLTTTNQVRLPNGKADNEATFSGTTPHSAKMSTPISDTDSSP